MHLSHVFSDPRRPGCIGSGVLGSAWFSFDYQRQKVRYSGGLADS